MFKSLRSRLILSYIVVIGVVLVLVSLVALLLLRSYQKDQALNRLADRATLATRLTAEALQRGMVPRQAVERLAQPLNSDDGEQTRIYLLTRAGRPVASSSDTLEQRRFDALDAREIPLPPRALRGEWRTAEGEHLLYVAQLVPAPEGTDARPAHIMLLVQSFFPLRLALGQLLPRMAWAGGIALAVSLLLAGLIAYSIARPLDRIARAAEGIAAGNYDHQLDITAPSEVARLAGSFNTMARQVKASLDSQRDLVANVSHELKTPLTSIQGFSLALLDGTAADDVGRERAASIIHEEAGRMRRLVDELLDLARLEGGEVALARRPVDVGQLLDDIRDRFAPQSEQWGVTLEVETLPELPPVPGDVDRLSQVFGNLVDNALKHTRSIEGGRVTLSAELRDGRVVLSVMDNGPGIPVQDLPRIFERFYQVDKSRVRVRKEGGAGLGLAIAREIVQAHGGTISVESVEGLGTKFRIELPVERRAQE